MDPRELGLATARGADALFLEGLIRMYHHPVGDVVVARTTEGRIVAVGLLSCSDRATALDAAAPGLYPPLEGGACWTEAHYVVPEYRARRAISGLLAEERDELRRRGIDRMVAIIDSANAPSIRAFARAGYEPTGVVRVDRYRFNRRSSRFVAIDGETRLRWERARTGIRTTR